MTQHGLDAIVDKAYDAGFVTNVAQDVLEAGLDESTVRFISAKKGEDLV